MNKLNFVASLPRSGSTLLMNFLGQNPMHHVTPTNGVIELFASVKKDWKKYIEFKSQGLPVIKPRVLGSLKGILLGFFEEELLQGKIIFDKSRGWLQYIEDLEEVLGRKVKIICCVRDVRDIVASFEKIYRKRGIEYDYPVGEAFYKCQSTEGRCEHLLSPGGVVGLTINRLRDALTRDVKDRLVLVPYKSLTEFPVNTMNILHQHLELPPFAYDPNDVKQITYEDDLWHGMDLHTIKNNVITPSKPNAWEGIIPPAYAESLAKRYADINKYALTN